MADMRRRVLLWTGSIVAVAAAAGLTVYLVQVGLDDADKLASVIGLFVAVAGLSVAGYKLTTGRSPEQKQEQLDGPSTLGQPSIALQGGNGAASRRARARPTCSCTRTPPSTAASTRACCRWRRCGRSPR